MRMQGPKSLTEGMRPQAPSGLAIALGFLLLGTPVAGLPAAPAAPASEQASGNGGQAIFDRAQTFLLRRDRGRAQQLFEEAEKAGGPYADLARLHRIRLLAKESRKEGETRQAAVRKLLDGFADPESGQMAWFLAAVSLYEAGEREAGLEIAVEAGRVFEGTRWGGAARLFAAEVFFENQEFAPCMDQLLRLLDDRESQDFEAAASLLLARVYLAPGEHHSPRRATHLLERFLSDRPPYSTSPWRGEARRLLARVRVRY